MEDVNVILVEDLQCLMVQLCLGSQRLDDGWYFAFGRESVCNQRSPDLEAQLYRELIGCGSHGRKVRWQCCADIDCIGSGGIDPGACARQVIAEKLEEV